MFLHVFIITKSAASTSIENGHSGQSKLSVLQFTALWKVAPSPHRTHYLLTQALWKISTFRKRALVSVYVVFLV